MNALLLILHLIPIGTPPSIDHNSAMPLCLSIYSSVRLSFCLSLFPYIHSSVLLFVFSSACPSDSLSIRLVVWPSTRLSVQASVRPGICLSVYLSVCLCVCNCNFMVKIWLQHDSCLLADNFDLIFWKNKINFSCHPCHSLPPHSPQ